MLCFLWTVFFLLGSSSPSTATKQYLSKGQNDQEDNPLYDIHEYGDQGVKDTLNNDWGRRFVRIGYHRGISFRKPRYTFVVVDRQTTGIIGRVKATSRNGLPIKYTLLTRRHYFKIDPYNGTIKISRQLPFRPVRTMATLTLIVAANPRRVPSRYWRNAALSCVRIVAVRRYIGDKILRGRRLIPTKINRLSKKVTAENLHRLVRRVSPKANPLATEMSTAQVKMDNACSRASFAIKQYFKKRYSTSVTISASIKDLLSPSTIQHLLNQSKCPKREIDLSFCRRSAKYRSIDGTCNSVRSPLYGSSSSAYTRLLPAKYYDPDGMKDPLGFPDLPNAPDVPTPLQITKKFLIVQKQSLTKRNTVSHFLMQWGQWVDHDFTLAPESEGADVCRQTSCKGTSTDYKPPCFTILPHKSSHCIHFGRTAAVCKSDTLKLTTREQMNANTAFIDGSQVYGSTLELANALRDFYPNKGLLRVRHFSHGSLLPADNSEMLFPNNLCRKTGGCFLAGDVRASEQMALASMHILFVREHNRIAKELLKINPLWSGNKTYQEARKIVGAILQKITYEDFLPALLGRNPLPPYSGYKFWVDPGIINSFAAAVFRYGHSTIRPFFDIVDEHFKPVGSPIPLKQMFFNNTFINKYGIKPLLLGICVNGSEIVDRSFATGILNHLFERPNSPGLNLAALNIQRGRDHGLPGYNDFRKLCHLSDAKTFEDTAKEITSPESRKILAELYYDNPSIADLWVAGIAETPYPGTELGPTFTCIIKEQFRRLRDGDRFFYQKSGVFSSSQLREIRKSSLTRVLCDNLKSPGTMTMQTNIFRAASYQTRRIPCRDVPGIDLYKWKDITA